MKFLEGAPVFAVEVRSECDYGPAAETRLGDKRKDYLAAGTRWVWDVDMQGPDVIRPYFRDDPDQPIVFRKGDLADAGNAVPGWSIPVDNLFPRSAG